MTEVAGLLPFGDRVAEAVTARRSQLVVGLDPDPVRLWPRAAALADGSAGRAGGAAQLAARAIAAHCALVLEAVAEECVAAKLQVACFERLGGPGWEALAEVAGRVREHGLLVIADAKRGDIDVTAAAYAHAFFGGLQTPWGEVASLDADALTLNPLLGADSLGPLLQAARERGRGLFLLVRTSNPGAADVQDLELAGGGSVSDRLAKLTGRLGREGVGDSGLSDVGAVVGATVPERIEALRQLMPQAIFLLPGVGAQGGTADRLGPAFAPGKAGGLISASRGIVGAYEARGGDPASAAREQARRLRERVWELA